MNSILSIGGNDYNTLKRLGSGGAGEVYLAVNCYTQEKVAIKVIEGKGFRSSIKEAMSALKETNIPTNVLAAYRENEIFDVVDERRPKVVKGAVINHYIHGVDASHVTSQTDFLQRALFVESLLEQGLEHLSHFEANDVLHRDIKPENIIVGPRNHSTWITFIDPDLLRKTNCGNEIVGTYRYLTPENLLYGTWSISSDLYAFLVTSFELLLARDIYNLCGNMWYSNDPLVIGAFKSDGTFEEQIRKNFLPEKYPDSMHQFLHNFRRLFLLTIRSDPSSRPKTIAEAQAIYKDL